MSRVGEKSKRSKELWKKISEIIKNVELSMTLGNIAKEKNIADSRNLYKKIGKESMQI